MKRERVVIEDPDMGTVICWRSGTFEVSASKRGVLVRSGVRRDWSWATDGAAYRVSDTSPFVPLVMMARSQHRLMKIGFPPVSAETEAMALASLPDVKSIREAIVAERSRSRVEFPWTKEYMSAPLYMGDDKPSSKVA